MMGNGKFVTAVNCMDGRVQLPVIEWLKATYPVEYVDMITEPGPNKILSSGIPDEIESIRKRVRISVEAHGSGIVALVAHGDCAGNPITKDSSIGQVKEGMEVIRSWNLPVTIIGLWVDSADWQVERVA
jgi:hypothetical protein